MTACAACQKPLSPFPLGEKNGYAFIGCKSCGSVMIDPPVTAEEREGFFAEVQPQIVHVPNPPAEIAGIKKTLHKAFGNGGDKRFLDISCRQGYAVMAAKELGFAAKGADPHHFFIDFAKSKYEAGLFEHATAVEIAARGETFDFIYASESFCEQADLEGYTAAIAKLLSPNGRLYISEPDGNHFMLPRTFTRWGFVDPPLNIIYLSRKGMDALLARHGLKAERSFFTFKPFMRLIVKKVAKK